MSIKPVWSVEANQDAERQITSPSYILAQSGNTNRPLARDFLLTQYMLSLSHEPDMLTKDCNIKAPKYVI